MASRLRNHKQADKPDDYYTSWCASGMVIAGNFRVFRGQSSQSENTPTHQYFTCKACSGCGFFTTANISSEGSRAIPRKCAPSKFSSYTRAYTEKRACNSLSIQRATDKIYYLLLATVYCTFPHPLWFLLTSCCIPSSLYTPLVLCVLIALPRVQVTLWKETPEGQWVCVSEVDKGQQQTQ